MTTDPSPKNENQTPGADVKVVPQNGRPGSLEAAEVFPHTRLPQETGIAFAQTSLVGATGVQVSVKSKLPIAVLNPVT